MLVANRDFTGVDERGRSIHFHKGRSRIAEGESLARKYCSYFDHVAGTRRGGRMSEVGGVARLGGAVGQVVTVPSSSSHKSRPSKPYGDERWRMPVSSANCELSLLTSRTRVRFAGEVRSLVVSFLDAVDGAEREAGLLLYGEVTLGMIQVLRADTPTIGDHDRMTFDFSQAADDLVGHVHSHPGGSCFPSRDDLSTWPELRREFALPVYLAAIGVAVRDGWSFVPYVVRLSDHNRDVAERGAPL